MSIQTIDNSSRTKEEIIKELTEIFNTKYHTVHEVKPYDNSDHLAAWVTYEEKDIFPAVCKKLREKDYYILNHQSTNRYGEKERQSYLIVIEEYE